MNTPKKARIDLRVPEELKEEIQKEAKKRNITVIDATCPLVTKVHKEALNYVKRGFNII